MTSPGLIRWGAIGFMLLGLAWFVWGFVSLGQASSYLPSAGYEPVWFGLWNPWSFVYLSWLFFTSAGSSDYPALFFVQMMLLALGLVGLHALQRGSYGIIGRVGFYVAFATTALLVLGVLCHVFTYSLLHQVLDMTPPRPGWVVRWVVPLVNLLGWFDPSNPSNLRMPTVSLLGWLYGFALLGVATLRAGVLPQRYGVLLIILWPVWLAPLATWHRSIWWSLGLIWLGLVLVVLGQALWSRRGAPPSTTSM
jgi:hypothetical protein